MEKAIIGVIFGGKSSEYYVSLASAFSVLESIDKGKYEVIKIGITKAGKWYLYEGKNEDILNDIWEKGCVKEITADINNGRFVAEGEPIKIHKILPILHGEYGEDGRVQSLLEIMNVSYAGCDSFSSFLAMDKDLTKKIARLEGVRVARGFTVYRGEIDIEKIHRKIKKIGYPVVIKPSNGGSSVGVSIVKNKMEIEKALSLAFGVSKKALIERKINGKEIEVALIFKNGKPYFSTLGEIGYTGDFYSYDEKYKNGTTEYIIPARVSKSTEKKIRKYAERLVLALGIRDVSRMDFFVNGNSVYFNEVNTMPGFTDISMLPKLLSYDKIEYKNIINYILNI